MTSAPSFFNKEYWQYGLFFQRERVRKAERPTKRWEDDLNEFVKEEETGTTQSNDLKTIRHGSLPQEMSTNGKRKKNKTPSKVLTNDEPNTSSTNVSPTTSVRTKFTSPSGCFRGIYRGSWRFLPKDPDTWLCGSLPVCRKPRQNWSFLFSIPDFPLISTHCRFTVTFETVEPMALTTRPDYRRFFEGS